MIFEVMESMCDGLRVIGCVLYHLLGLTKLLQQTMSIKPLLLPG